MEKIINWDKDTLEVKCNLGKAVVQTGVEMSVAGIADIFGVHQTTISKYIKKLFPEKVKPGVITLLNESEVTRIKLELQQNQHLSQSSNLPKTNLEKKMLVQQAMQILNEEIEELKLDNELKTKQLEVAKPKVEFHDELIESEGLYSMGETAKLLGTGRTRLFLKLREIKVFFNTEPYQTYKERGYFEVKTTTKNGYVRTQAFTTPKGLEWLRKKLKSDGEFHTSF